VEVDRKCLAEAEHVLGPGGVSLLSSPYCRMMPHSCDAHHIHEYQADSIRAKVSERFTLTTSPDGILIS